MLTPIIALCNSNDIQFINFGNDKRFIHNEKYFKDGLHLNEEGADEFTKELMRRIKSIK